MSKCRVIIKKRPCMKDTRYMHEMNGNCGGLSFRLPPPSSSDNIVAIQLTSDSVR